MSDKERGKNRRRRKENGDTRRGDRQKKEEKRPMILTKPTVSTDSSEKTDSRNIDFPTLAQAHQRLPFSFKRDTKSPSLESEGAKDSAQSNVGIINIANKTLFRRNSFETKMSEKKIRNSPTHSLPSFENPTPERRFRFIGKNFEFHEGLNDFLTDCSDFLVIGIVGNQSVGKSTILNGLIKSDFLGKDAIFPVQSFEKQMVGEHCTNGINAWINSDHIIFLDCQPLNSSTILERMISNPSKYNLEFGDLHNNMQIGSLQLTGFLMNICHVLIVTQDVFVDTNMIRYLRNAEMLKPFSPTVDDEGVIEYFPTVFFAHNKCVFEDYVESSILAIKNFYEISMKDSELNIRNECTDDVNLSLFPDFSNDSFPWNNNPVSFTETIVEFRQKIFSLPRHQLTTSKLTEKTWLSFAQKNWESVKNCQFYMEYNRLLALL